LDEAEHDTRIIQTEVNVICRSEADADNIDRGLNVCYGINDDTSDSFVFIVH
jgi:hypothetical protein